MVGLRHLLARGPLPWLLALAAGAFVLMLALDAPTRSPVVCGLPRSAALAGASVGAAVAPVPMMLAWLLMLAAMMPPLLAPAVSHVWLSSFRDRRPLALALFGLGYVFVWVAAGALLVPAAMRLREWNLGVAGSLALLALAFAWSGSPPAQMARNACHRVRMISPFGRRADVDCFSYGVMSGLPCAAACWPWMLAPMASDRLHLPIMAAATLLLFLERLAPTERPTWRSPPSLTMAAAFLRP